MASRARSLFTLSVSLAVLCVLLSATSTRAHPPWNPYDQTRFAPITSFGPQVGIEVVTRGVNDPETGNPIGPTLTAPLKAVAAPGLPNHLFIVDQVGKLWVVRLSDNMRTLFFDLSARLVTLGVCGPDTFDERGFLGVAFHPNYDGRRPGPGRGLFYTYTSERRDSGVSSSWLLTPGTTDANSDHHNVVAEWRADDPSSVTPTIVLIRELMRVNWPQFNHDGGDLAFGPDGKLYISMGDGGGADDADGQPFIVAPPHQTDPTKPLLPCGSQSAPIFGHQDNGNGQKLNTTLGKIHRIDVDGTPTPPRPYRLPADNPFVGRAGAVQEIWALGFRNPYRFSFDSKRGDLYVGDVGQNDIEEVDIVKKGGNFGWNCKEGTLFFYINGSVPDDGFADPSPNRPQRRGDCVSGPRPLRDPIAQYDTHHEGHSVIGGFVCNRCGVSSLRGKYVFGEFARVFKFPSGPHDYGRVLAVNSGDGHGLRSIRELLVLPSGDLGLAVLGIGQDARGDIYVMGNVFGVPFGNAGVVVRLVRALEADDREDDDDDNDDDDDD